MKIQNRFYNVNRHQKFHNNNTIPIGDEPDTGFVILLDLVGPDPDFPAFQRCPRLNS
jgi:hypothetical protein